jgi:hypothetical protein
MPKIQIYQGQSIPSVAKDNGFFWETLWNHPENSALKEKRKNPNVLFEGDEVFVPELETKEVTKPTEAKHKFKRKGDPLKFKLQLLMMGKPRKNEEYVLVVDGKQFRGKTDGEGKLEETLPGNATGGVLRLRGGKEEYPVRIGHLDPIDTNSGVKQRLNNLGFPCGSEDDELDDDTRAALQKFQNQHHLEVTGEADDATKAKLGELHP